jgi:hypothetical protein
MVAHYPQAVSSVLLLLLLPLLPFCWPALVHQIQEMLHVMLGIYTSRGHKELSQVRPDSVETAACTAQHCRDSSAIRQLRQLQAADSGSA